MAEDIQTPLPWIKRDTKQMFIETLPLKLPERGAFQTVFDLICFRGGEIVDDDDSIVRYLGVYPKTWHRIRDVLIAGGYLYREGNNMLRSKYADQAYGFARKVVPLRSV